MGRRSTIGSLSPVLNTAAVDCIRAHRHMTLDRILAALKEKGFENITRSALHRYIQILDKKDSLCANPNEGAIVTIVERGTGEVRTVKSSASGKMIEILIKQIGTP